MADQIPLVNYLALGARPALKANECKSCGARFFDRRSACAKCSATDFKSVRIKNKGTVQSFSIVHMAAPGLPVPYVSAIVDCDGTSVRANLLDIEPEPEAVTLGMPVKLKTYVYGTDDEGTECVAFGFAPA